MIAWGTAFVLGAIAGYLIGLNRNRKTAKEELDLAQRWTSSQIAQIHKKIDELIAKYKNQ